MRKCQQIIIYGNNNLTKQALLNLKIYYNKCLIFLINYQFLKKLKLLTMDFIDIISSICQHQNLSLFALQAYIKKQYPQFKVRSNNQCIFLACLLDKIQNIQIISNIMLNFADGIVCLQFIPSGIHLIKCKNHQIKINLLKKFLQLTAKHNNFNFKLNMKSGDVALNIITTFTKNGRTLEKIIDPIIEILFCLQQKIIIVLKKLLNLVEEIHNIPSLSKNQISQTEDILKKFKTYIKSSDQYSWSVFRANTKKNQQNKQDFYQQTKKNFRELKKSCRQNLIPKLLSKTNLIESKEKIPFFMLTHNEDLQLKNRYLTKGITISKNSRQIEEIQLQNDELEKLLKQKSTQFLINNRKVKLHVNKKQKHQILSVAYQREIIKLLFCQQYIGIPKYYIIKKHQDQTKNLILTNLINTQSLTRFLESNQQTMSRHTKHSFLTQITITLKYLRDQSISFNNLTTDNLQIRKGILKFTNFQNCYHPEIFRHTEQFKTSFPFISVFKRGQIQSYSSQKCDVFSLGVVLHLLLFGKTHINIKNRFSLLSQQKMIEYYKTKPIIAIEKFKSFGQQNGMLLANLSLMATHFNIYQYESDQIDSKQLRPYLDWMMIMMKFNEETYNNGI